MTERKIIAVAGSTGAQGGGLCRAILSDPNGGFFCRAITRDPKKEAAQALAASGAEVIAADLDDRESLTTAFSGAYGAYCVTNFWEHMSAEKEKAQARNLADAARAAGVKHVIWSTLEDTRPLMQPGDTRMPMLQQKYRVPHFDAKAEANTYFAGLPITFLVTYGIFKAGPQYIGKTVGVAGEHLTIKEMGEKLSKVLGLGPVTYNAVDPDAYRKFGFPGADEMGNMFQVYRDFEKEVVGARSVAISRSLNPALQTFEDWVRTNKDKIPV